MLKKILKTSLASLLSFSAYAQVPTNGLVAHYPFDGNTNDVSGNGYNLTVNGSVSYTTDNLSKGSSAISLASAYLTNSNSGIMPTGSYSVAYWAKSPNWSYQFPTVLEMNEGIYCRYHTATLDAQLGGYFSSSQNYQHKFGFSRRSEWNHFVITVDVATGKSFTYLNSVLQVEKTGISYNSTILQNKGLIIGSGTNSGNINAQKFLGGQVDEVLIYNRALSSAEAKTIYEQRFEPAAFIGDFENFTASQTTANAVKFEGWTGESNNTYVSNNGVVTKSSASLKAEVVSTPGSTTCSEWVYDKFTGKQYCNSYITSPTTYAENFQNLSQSVTIKQMPLKITGEFGYSTTNTTLSAAMIIEGNFNGQRFQDTLIVNNSKPSPTELIIGNNYIPCQNANTGGEIISGNDCPVANTIQVKLVSCFNCPSSTNLGTSYFSVDNLKIVYADPTALEEQMVLSQPSIYPNPATDFVNVTEFAEIFDLVGNKVAEGTDKIDVSSLTNGIYFVKTAKGFDKLIVE